MSVAPREPQYQVCLDLRARKGPARLGLMSSYLWESDPRHLAFLFSRYKFVAKMLSGRSRVLEVGCGDAFASRLVLQEVDRLTVVDFDPMFVDDIRSRADEDWPLDARVHDMLQAPLAESFDGAYALDVLEHISPAEERRFLGNIVASLHEEGVLVIGMPSLNSQAYASPPSRAGHVNCKHAPDLKRLLEEFYRQVVVFSMNDEVVHTGFHPMAHYLLALCSSPRRTGG
jgi:SAM-dependent methyltransferase